jgi:hypothetical protein
MEKLMKKVVYVLTNDDCQGSLTLGIYGNEDAALRALAGRFNLATDRYNWMVSAGLMETADTIKPEWGCREEESFYTDDQCYQVLEQEVLD